MIFYGSNKIANVGKVLVLKTYQIRVVPFTEKTNN